MNDDAYATLPEPSAFSWDEALAIDHPITVTPLITGSAPARLAFLINLLHPAMAGEENLELVTPITAFLVRRDGAEPFLVDAGLNSRVSRDGFGALQGVLPRRFFAGWQQEPGQGLADRLAGQGVAGEDLEGVYFTHLHPDHTAGMHDLPSRTATAAGRGELYVNVRPLYYNDDIDERDLTYIDASSAPRMPPFGRCVDVYGDGSFWAVPTPGHTPGHMSYLINGREKRLITGDACNLRLGLERRVGPGLYSLNIIQAQRSLERMAEFLARYPGVRPLIGHQAE